MKKYYTKKLNASLVLAIMALGLSGITQAAVVGEQTVENSRLLLDTYYDGSAGAGVDGVYDGYLNSFGSHLSSYADEYGFYDSSTGIYSFTGKQIADAGAPSPHEQYGVWVFKQVGSADIWFGEWSQATQDSSGEYTNTADTSTRTAFYVGDGADTSLTLSSNDVTYTVSGINNGNTYTGTFTANFGSSKNLSGSLTGALGTFNLDSVGIDDDATFSGTSATWTSGSTTLDDGGVVSGQFFNNQTALAGIADFGSTTYDISFGGTKD
jgi:hypothetical protein